VTRARPLSTTAHRGLLALFGVLAIYAGLVPLGTGGGQPVPDLLYCLAVAWVVRRPASAPLWMILGLGLFGDVMLSRPIGLGALGLLLATETMRANATVFHGSPFVLEWLAAIAAFALSLGGMEVLLRLAFADGPGATALIGHLLSTALAYPLVAAGMAWGLGLRAPRGSRTGNRLGGLR
jgi:rod shape-determining protein MreD